MYVNIQGILSHKEELEMVVASYKPKIVSLSETHLTEDIQSSELVIKGYKLECCFSTSRHTGGVSIYVKNGVKFKKIINEVLILNSWILGLKVIINNKPYSILTLYHSPNASHSEFIDHFKNTMDNYDFGNSTVVVLGDFNINMAVNNFYKNRLISSIGNLGFYQIMDQFTRITNNSSTIIDLLVTNLNFKVLLTPKISDHSIITVDFKVKETSFIGYKSVRNFKNFNETDFQLQLLSEEWDADCTDVDIVANNLTSQIIKLLDIHAPSKTITINTKFPQKGWWNEEIKEQMNERDRLFKKATITREVEHWNMYKRQRNQVVSLIRQHKTKYYEDKIDDCKGDSVSMWKTLKEITKSKNDTYTGEVIFGEERISDNEINK